MPLHDGQNRYKSILLSASNLHGTDHCHQYWIAFVIVEIIFVVYLFPCQFVLAVRSSDSVIHRNLFFGPLKAVEDG